LKIFKSFRLTDPAVNVTNSITTSVKLNEDTSIIINVTSNKIIIIDSINESYDENDSVIKTCENSNYKIDRDTNGAKKYVCL